MSREDGEQLLKDREVVRGSRSIPMELVFTVQLNKRGLLQGVIKSLRYFRDDERTDVIYELDLHEPSTPRESGAKLLKEAESLVAPLRKEQ